MSIKNVSVFVLLAVFSAISAAANCEFFEGHSQGIVAFDIPSELSIPRDAINGTVLYESPPLTLGPINSSWHCSFENWNGVINNVGTTTPGQALLPIGDTGIAWKWGPDLSHSGYPNFSRSAGGWGWHGSAHTLQLIKTGNISAGTKIPSGVLGYFQSEEVRPLALQIRAGSVVVQQSCEAPDVHVDMGTHKLSTFPHNGSYSPSVKFNISIKNCPAGLNKITYELKPTPTSPARNSMRGIINLNKSSTAKGLTLQILSSDESPLVLHQDYVAKDINNAGGSFDIPLAARYFRVIETGSNGAFEPGMGAGSANAEIWFIMSYL